MFVRVRVCACMHASVWVCVYVGVRVIVRVKEMEGKGYTKFRKREKTPDTVIWSPSLRANNKT